MGFIFDTCPAQLHFSVRDLLSESLFQPNERAQQIQYIKCIELLVVIKHVETILQYV